MWFKYGLKAQKLLAQGVWGLPDSFCPLPFLRTVTVGSGRIG